MKMFLFVLGILIPLVGAPTFLEATTIHVPADQPNVQAGINAAQTGDTVLVAPGTYFENIDFMGKTITVKSQDGPTGTVIDGGLPIDPDRGSVVVFLSGEGLGSVLQGFTLTNGTGTDTGKTRYGGGIYCLNASPSIRDNLLSLNYAKASGGGIYCEGGDPQITGNTFSENTAYDQGGGIAVVGSSPLISNNLFTFNKTEQSNGGAVICKYGGTPEIRENVIEFNTTRRSGGGIAVYVNCDFAYIEDNVINNNEAEENGGGIYIYSPCLVQRNVIMGNRSDTEGGGIHVVLPDVRIHNNKILSNEAHDGGGINLRYTASTISDCQIVGNRCTNGRGGGIRCERDTQPLIKNCDIVENEALRGGGFYALDGAEPRLEGCRIKRNISSASGAGVECYGWSKPVFEGCVIEANEAATNGGGISVNDHACPAFLNCLVAKNTAGLTGGGVYGLNSGLAVLSQTDLWGNAAQRGGAVLVDRYAEAYVANCVFWNNQSSTGKVFLVGDHGIAALHIDHSDLEGGQASVETRPGSLLYWGSGMIDEDPSFLDPEGGDFHIPYTSPLRDAGGDSAYLLPDIDFEGDPRQSGRAVDIGADEFHPHLYCLDRAVPGGRVDVKITAPPFEIVTVVKGSGVLDPPLTTPYGDWYLEFPILFLGWYPTPVDGCLSVELRIPPGYPAPSSVPLQAYILETLTNLCEVVIQ